MTSSLQLQIVILITLLLWLTTSLLMTAVMGFEAEERNFSNRKYEEIGSNHRRWIRQTKWSLGVFTVYFEGLLWYHHFNFVYTALAGIHIMLVIMFMFLITGI